MTALRLWVTVILAVWFVPAMAQTVSDTAATKHVEVRLIAEGPVPADGGPVTVALVQKIIPGWHTYWRNAGDSGEPTKIEWKLPQGFSAKDIQWPVPERIPIGPLANFGFKDEVWLLTEIQTPKGLTPGSMTTIEADVAWLVCEEICIPEDAKLRLEIDVEKAPTPNAQWREAFARARAAQPETPAIPAVYAIQDGKLGLSIALPEALRQSKAQFFPDVPGFIKNAADQAPSDRDGALVLHIPGGSKVRIAEEAAKIETISGVLVFDGVGGQRRAVTVTASRGAVPEPAALTEAAPSAGATALTQAPVNPDGLSFGGALLFALLGGLILNLMPCVFPVLSMKAMALVRNGDVTRGQAIADGMAYLGGVLVTFCALAAAVIVLRNAGEAVGWGFQLQSPFVVAILAYVLFAVGLNLSGVFHAGGSLMGLGSSLQSSHGNSLSGSFMTGVLAVVVAAPCTVPFMGAAVGYALTQSSVLTFLIFIALGFGLALPWLVISFVPGLTAFIPRGGEWTNRIKEFLAFPMYASVAWLVWVLSQQTDSGGLFRVLLGLVAIAFAAWALGRAQAAQGVALVSTGAAIAAVLGSIALISAPALPPPRLAAASASEAYKGPPYEPYTPQRLQALLAEGKPVFVNLTAAWCITCLFNEQVALDTEAAKADFAATGTVYLKGDWTNRDPAITALLRAHGRDGVPLYLHFPAGKSEPAVLPQVLTPAIISSAIRFKNGSP
jgi:thiol:disulfide interchange protein/DsbC/DsbD-like thiol-disulfide interchange protein